MTHSNVPSPQKAPRNSYVPNPYTYKNCVRVGLLQYVDRFPLPHVIESTSIQANRAPTGDLVVTAAINDSSEDSDCTDTENS